MAKLIAACLALGAISLAFPSEASYDPWAWLVWGRELVSLDLDTAGGPSWKPLPVAVTALAAPLGALDSSLPPAVWMVVARAGALLALVLAFRLARRIAGGGSLGTAGGAVAVLVLVLTPDWFQFAAHGSEAPLAMAFGLWAVEHHLDGRPGHAVVLCTLACMLRPELFPFSFAYALYAGWTRPRLRKWLGPLGAALAAAWLVPEWVGTGNPLDGGAQARSEPPWSLSHADSPWLRAMARIHNHAGHAAELLAAAAVVAAVARRDRVVLVLAALAAAEGALFVAMTQAGFSGSPRYVLPALTIGCVLAGVGAAAILGAAEGRPTRLAVAAVALAALMVPSLAGNVERLRRDAREVAARMSLHGELVDAVRAAGGREHVNRLGPASVSSALQTRLAWELHRPMSEVEAVRRTGVVFESRTRLAGKPVLRRPAGGGREVARAGSWRVYVRPAVHTAFAGISHRYPGCKNLC